MEKHFCPYCMAPVKAGEPCAACGLTAGTYTPSPHHLPPGTILMERYLVGRVLGEGGFGITYIGCDLRLELKVAIKEYFPSDKVTRHAQASLEVSNYTGALAGNYEQGKEKYLQEARTMARMNKQAEIVSVRDFFEANNTAYIVMEYVEGTTFKELVAQKGGRIPAGEFLHMIEPLFSALSEMHATGLIHRDISPDNLMLENGSVRLLDFGCARESTHGTETMTIALKHGYAPIEQYQHKGQGPWTDVYGLCATMYYCLTGKVPQQSLDRLCEDELILPRKLGVDLTENQERALLYGMGIRPRRRYQNIEELYAALYTGVPAPKIEVGQSILFAPETGQASAAGTESGAEGSKEAAAGAKNGNAAAIKESADAGGTPKTEAVSGALDAEEAVPDFGETDGGQTEEKREKRSRQIKIAAAAAGILCLVASPFLLQGKLREAASDSVEEPTKEVVDESAEETKEELFADAAAVASGSETALRAALGGDAKAVVWDGEGGIQLTGEALTLTKPLYIGENAQIEIATNLTIGDGGQIRIAGELQNRGLLQAKGDGKIVVEQGGRLNGPSSVFVEGTENLVVEEGGTTDIRGRDFAEVGFDRLSYVLFSEDEIFSDAVSVTTEDALRTALENDAVSAVVIKGDITLEESFRHMQKSVMVSEGVTVTAPEEADAALCFDGLYFVNYGTVSGRFQVGDWNENGAPSNVINYGRISNDMFVESDCNIVNLGQMTMGSGWMHNGQFYNLGELVHDDSRGDDIWLTFLNTQFTNLGTVRIEGDAAKDEQVIVEFGGGTELLNHGVVEIGTAGGISNSAHICGYGQIFATDGTSGHTSAFWNEGVIRMEYAPASGKAASLNVPDGAQFNNEGIITCSALSSFSVPGEIEEYGGAYIPYAWGDNGGDFRYVSTAEELKEALGDDACGVVVVSGEGDITLEEELVVTKGLAVAWPTNLCFTGGGLRLTGAKAYLYDAKLVMNGNPITVSDGAALYVESLREGGDLDAENGGKVILCSYEEEAFRPGMNVTLKHGSRLLSAGYNKMEGKTVSVESGSIFRMTGEYEMADSHIEIEDGAELMIQTPHGWMDENSVITNNGKFVLGSWNEHEYGGEVVNNNEMECYAPWKLNGQFINNGRFRIDIGDNTMTGGGTIENNGTFLTPEEGVLREFEGGYSGNEVENGEW